MAKITFSKLNLKLNKDEEKIKIGENEITVRKYLPQVEKAELIGFVIERSLDEKTGCFSPIRLETYFALAVMKWYTDITFTDNQAKVIPDVKNTSWTVADLSSATTFAALVANDKVMTFTYGGNSYTVNASDVKAVEGNYQTGNGTPIE